MYNQLLVDGTFKIKFNNSCNQIEFNLYWFYQNLAAMDKRMYALLLTLCLISISPLAEAKPRAVYLDKELKEASLIEYVEITGYADSMLTVKPVEGKKTFNIPVGHVMAMDGIMDILTSHWPVKGEKVLVVLNTEGKLSLFAYKQDTQYRFWSPHETGSLAIFYFKKPAAKLPDQKGLSYDTGEYETCWDGCLLPTELVKTYGRE